MSSSFKTIKEQAKALPPEERADLAHELITSLDDEFDTDVESVWDKEIQRRVADIKSGKTKGRIAEDILAEIRAKFS
ncbi:MAG: addiction module protein [bacterium]